MKSIPELQAELNRLKAIHSVSEQKRNINLQRKGLIKEINKLKHPHAVRVFNKTIESGRHIGKKSLNFARERAREIHKIQSERKISHNRKIKKRHKYNKSSRGGDYFSTGFEFGSGGNF